MDYNTKFKQDLEKLFKLKNVSETSIKMYIRNLEKLNEDMPLKNLKFLGNVDEILNKLKNYKPNTYRGYLISICSALKFDDNKNMKKIYDKYYELLMKTNKELKENEKKQEKTETQKNNWITWDEVEKKYNELLTKVDKIKKMKELNNHKYNILLDFIVLSLYTLIAPKRNQDWALMNIIYKNDNTLPITNNYLDYSNKKFIFNKYKTSKSKGELVENIPEKLFENINIYLKFHPLIKGKKITKNFNVPFLVYYDGKNLSSVNSITRILNHIFEKNISSSMLRHIYLTDKYGETVKDMKKDAEIMGHTPEMAINNYIKK
jgi:hypothetical protein